MLFKETRILEFNRVALRLLMSEFYRASGNNWALFDNISKYKQDEKRLYAENLARIAARATVNGTAYAPRVLAQADAATRAGARDQSEILFSRLISFVQLKYHEHKQGLASVLFDGPLKGSVIKELTNQLKDPELRSEILASYFPGRPHYVSYARKDMAASLALLAPFQKAQQPALLPQPIEVPGLMPTNVIEVDFSQTPPAPEGPQPPAIRVA